MKVLREVERYTRLTDNKTELNEQIASEFTIAEQKLLVESVRKMLTIEFFHVLSLMRTEREIKESIRNMMNNERFNA